MAQVSDINTVRAQMGIESAEGFAAVQALDDGFVSTGISDAWDAEIARRFHPDAISQPSRVAICVCTLQALAPLFVDVFCCADRHCPAKSKKCVSPLISLGETHFFNWWR